MASMPTSVTNQPNVTHIRSAFREFGGPILSLCGAAEEWVNKTEFKVNMVDAGYKAHASCAACIDMHGTILNMQEIMKR